jgi:hypothetical protein
MACLQEKREGAAKFPFLGAAEPFVNSAARAPAPTGGVSLVGQCSDLLDYLILEGNVLNFVPAVAGHFDAVRPTAVTVLGPALCDRAGRAAQRSARRVRENVLSGSGTDNNGEHPNLFFFESPSWEDYYATWFDNHLTAGSVTCSLDRWAMVYSDVLKSHTVWRNGASVSSRSRAGTCRFRDFSWDGYAAERLLCWGTASSYAKASWRFVLPDDAQHQPFQPAGTDSETV